MEKFLARCLESRGGVTGCRNLVTAAVVLREGHA